MSKTLTLFIAALAIAGASTAAQAAVLVHVSGKGADAAGCGTAAAPCRTLQLAHDRVDAGGYIVAIDPADFGGVVVSKSVSIANESAGVARLNAPIAVDINAPDATVRLRGMTIEAEGTAIYVRNAEWLDITDCSVKGPYGIATTNSGYFAPALRIALLNTSFSKAIAVWGQSQAMFAKNTRINGVVYVFNSAPRPFVFEDGLIEGDPSWAASIPGISAWETVGVVHNSVIRSLPIGLDANSSIFLLSKSTITGNKLALRRNTDQSMFQSAGDNVIRGNTDDALGIVTPLALH